MSSSTNKPSLVRYIAVSAVMVALSTALSFVKIWQMPLGGSVTLLSMVPICTIGLIYGTGYAILPCLIYGAIQMLQGGVFAWGLTPGVLVAAILLDYIVAFGVMCLSGLFYKKGPAFQLVGVVIALVARFACHFVSGVVLWENFDIYNNPYIYSLVYNGTYMLPELVLTLIGFSLLIFTGAFQQVKKLARG